MSAGIDHRHPYVAAPAGAREQTDALAREAAARWGLPAPRFLRRGMNALYTAGDEVVIRIGRPTAPAGAASDLAALLTAEGIRVPRPSGLEPQSDGEHTAFAFERLHLRRGPAGDPLPSDHRPEDWEEVGRMIACLHHLDPQRVAAQYPLPRTADLPWWQFTAQLDSVRDLLDADTVATLADLVTATRGWAERAPEVVCHGDLQPHNVIVTDEGPVILDWDLLCRAPAPFDLAPLLHWADRWGGREGLPEAFVRGYGYDLRTTELAEPLGLLRLLAATLMRLAAGRHDPAARADAEQRLRWWRGDPDAPLWTPR